MKGMMGWLNDYANRSFWSNYINRYETVIALGGSPTERILPRFCCFCGRALKMSTECEDSYLWCPDGADPWSDRSNDGDPCPLPVLTVHGGGTV